jgi:hypothetical protein
MSPLPENHEMPFHERWGEDFTEFWWSENYVF